MADRPIIFSAGMVGALLAGRKTQTRRLSASPLRRCAAGDRLYVREAWKPVHSGDPSRGARYRFDAGRDQTVWRPSIHMPRWASRLTLIVETVRLEQLRELSALDARAEGVERDGGDWRNYGTGAECLSAIESYATLWDSLHDKSGERWRDNPAVVALIFRVEHGNIDRVPHG